MLSLSKTQPETRWTMQILRSLVRVVLQLTKLGVTSIRIITCYYGDPYTCLKLKVFALIIRAWGVNASTFVEFSTRKVDAHLSSSWADACLQSHPLTSYSRRKNRLKQEFLDFCGGGIGNFIVRKLRHRARTSRVVVSCQHGHGASSTRSSSCVETLLINCDRRGS